MERTITLSHNEKKNTQTCTYYFQNVFLDSMEKIALNCVETAKRGQYATLDRECVLLVVKSISYRLIVQV